MLILAHLKKRQKSYENMNKKVCKARMRPLCMKWKKVDTKMLLVFLSMYEKAIPQLQYDSRYNGNNSFKGLVIKCSPPKIKLEIVMKRKSFLNMALKPNLKTLSSKSGARITADMKVYIGKDVNSVLIAVSLVDRPPPNIFIKMFEAIIVIRPII